LTLTKAGTGKEYTSINSVIPEDSGPLHTDANVAKTWIDDELSWSDVYSKKSEDYLEMVAKGEVPRWDTNSNKWVSNSSAEETIGSPKSTTPVVDPQDDFDVDTDLPF
jgi:hypothetical protein